jgi:hypothetical protein
MYDSTLHFDHEKRGSLTIQPMTEIEWVLKNSGILTQFYFREFRGEEFSNSHRQFHVLTAGQ